MLKDDGRCTYTDPETGERCDVTNPRALDAHHVDDTGRLLCNSLGNSHHAKVDRHAR